MKQFCTCLMFCIVALGISSCEDEKVDDLTPSETRFFVEFLLNGDTVKYRDGDDGYGNGPGYSTYNDQHGRLMKQFSTFGRNTIAPDTMKSAISVQVVKFVADTLEPSFQTRFQTFSVGSYGFGSYNEDSTNVGIDGAIIAYMDVNGKVWSSDRLFGTQSSGSSFVITEHVAADDALYGGRTRGTFNCTVFDGLGNSLAINSGRFYARTILK